MDDVTKHLGLAKDAIYRWIERRGLPVQKIGRLRKFKLSEVDEWVRDQDAYVTDDDEHEGAER